MVNLLVGWVVAAVTAVAAAVAIDRRMDGIELGAREQHRLSI